MAGARTAATRPGHEDPRLAGRTYAIPFEDVWQGALRIIREKSKGWTLDLADDREGIITADIKALHRSYNGTFEVRVTLDMNGQTRVDASTATPSAFADLGVNVRRLHRFFTALDREADREYRRRTAPVVAARAR